MLYPTSMSLPPALAAQRKSGGGSAAEPIHAVITRVESNGARDFLTTGRNLPRKAAKQTAIIPCIAPRNPLALKGCITNKLRCLRYCVSVPRFKTRGGRHWLRGDHRAKAPRCLDRLEIDDDVGVEVA